jgi:hypothetical protein
MTRHIVELLPLSQQRPIDTYEMDATQLSVNPTLAEARAAAINHGWQFGESTTRSREPHGDQRVEMVEPDFRARDTNGCQGPHVES